MKGCGHLEENQLFELIDQSYNEDLSNQPQQYKDSLLNSAKMLVDGSDELNACVTVYKSYHENYIIPMSLPKENRLLYLYVQDKLKKLDQKRLRDFNIGYGIIASHYTFNPFN
ncbi:bacteriocin immunity protein [Enterococcus raffinosus]|nr:bacteriocin immunity protein [Enterococcus raffinosus]